MEGEFFLANRPEHLLALDVLATLDADFLKNAECWFAGGTAVSLRCDEFRASRDIDFLCSSKRGYRLLRERIYDQGVRGLFCRDITIKRDARADQYGIRFVLDVRGTLLKFELVREGRVDLDGVRDPALPVSRLSDQDLVASKLLANDDRFLDEATLARDVIDLLMLEHELGALPEESWNKARSAYGDSVESSLRRAQQHLRDNPVFLKRVFQVLSITPKAQTIIQEKLSLNS
jgi:hypothetical protein